MIIERDTESGAPIEVVLGSYRRQFYYDHHGFIVLVDDSKGLSTELRHDDVGRVVLIKHGERQLLRRGYDLAGRLVASARMGKLVELVWSEQGQCSQVRDLDGERALAWEGGKLVRSARGATLWRAERDGLGGIVALHGPEGEMLSLRHGRHGLLAEWSSADGFARSFGWHLMGALDGYRDANDEVTFVRDGVGRLCSVPHADLHVAYDGHGAPSRVVGHGIDEVYEGLTDARSLMITREERCTELLVRDELGRLIERKAGARPDVRLDWSAAGHLARIESSERVGEPAASFAPPSRRERVWTFEHDISGGIVRASEGDDAITLRRSNGLVVEEISASDRIAVVRSETGHRIAVSSSRGLEIEYQRDGADRVARLVARLEGCAIDVGFEHDHDGREVVRRCGDVEIQLVRSSLGQVTRRRVVRRGQVIDHAEYAWKGARLASIGGADGAPRWSFDHDRAGTLRAMREGSSEWVTCATEPYRGHAPAGCTFDDAGRPLAHDGVSFAHDSAGLRVARRAPSSELTSYRYDVFRRLVLIDERTRTIAHAHDPLGRRTATTLAPKSPKGGPADDGDASRSTNGQPSEARIDYVWDARMLLHRIDSTGGRVTYVHADGSLVAQTVDGSPYLVLPGPGGDLDGLLAMDGSIVWTRHPETLVFGAVDDGIRRYGVPALPGHHLDPLSGHWFCLWGDLDGETGRYLTPSPFGVAAGPWLYAPGPDPISPRSGRLPRHPMGPFAELSFDSFDVVWNGAMRESMTCHEDEAGLRAWATLADDTVLDAERLLLHSS